MQTKTGAVIVTFNPPPGFAERAAKAASQVDLLVIVDNSGREMEPEITLAARETGALLVLNRENKGLASAQNRGINLALEEGCDWILLLDHDSFPEENMVSRLLAAWEAQPERDKIAILAPDVRDINSSAPHRFVIPGPFIFFRRVSLGEKPLFPLAAISSGSLISARALRQHGLMREDFFIDQIDNEYCLRLRAAGLRVMAVPGAALSHAMGEKKERRLMGLRIVTGNHSPSRRYYMYRNRLRLWRIYGSRIPVFVAYDVMAICYDLLRITLFEENKWEKLKSAWRGAREGLQPLYSPSVRG